MLKKSVGQIWKRLTPGMRAKLVRSIQSAFTVSAAAIITNEEGKVLLLDHVLRPHSSWGYPGGFVNKGEQADDAVRREVREETGIELEDVRLVDVRTSASGRHLEILFIARGVGDPEVHSREITDFGWFAVDDLPEEMSRAQKEQIRKILSESSSTSA